MGKRCRTGFAEAIFELCRDQNENNQHICIFADYRFYIVQGLADRLAENRGFFPFHVPCSILRLQLSTIISIRRPTEQVLQFERRIALAIIYVLFGLSMALGLYLAYLTDIVVLLLGGLCFLAGVLYTYGPVPISRQPLGEVMSGVFYGLFIPFLLLYINMPEGTFITFGKQDGRVSGWSSGSCRY